MSIKILSKNQATKYNCNICNKLTLEVNLSKKVCKDCWNKYPKAGDFDFYNPPKKLSILNDEKYGIYLAASHNSKHPYYIRCSNCDKPNTENNKVYKGICEDCWNKYPIELGKTKETIWGPIVSLDKDYGYFIKSCKSKAKHPKNPESKIYKRDPRILNVTYIGNCRNLYLIECEGCHMPFNSYGHNAIFCKTCSEYINWLNDHICSNCVTFVEKRDQNGYGYDCGCVYTKRKELADNNRISGKCSLCKRYNKERDQNGRGKDIYFGIGEWIAENDILDKSNNIIVHIGEKCGCNCSKKAYDELHKSNYSAGNCTNPLCKKWNEHRNSAGLGIECGCSKKNLDNANSYLKIHYKFCEKCNCETPHKYNKETNELYCQSCKNEKIWCERCERWEIPSFNSKPNHWMFWATETKQWIDDNPNKVAIAKKIIIGLNDLLNSPVITGVYGWFVNDQISYVGESIDILTRSWNHIMYIFEEPDYWYNVIDYFDKNKIEVKILKSIDKNCNEYKNMSNKEFKKNVLKPLELDFIAKLHPDSQKCDGTDHIRPIEEREIQINK